MVEIVDVRRDDDALDHHEMIDLAPQQDQNQQFQSLDMVGGIQQNQVITQTFTSTSNVVHHQTEEMQHVQNVVDQQTGAMRQMIVEHQEQVI